jgi:NADH-quinone oxidoreductase subunit N
VPFNAPEIQLSGIAPELAVIVTAFVILIAVAFLRDEDARVFGPLLASIGLVVAIFFALGTWGDSELQISGMVALDPFATFVKVVLAVFGLLSVWVARDFMTPAPRPGNEPEDDSTRKMGAEFYALVLFAVSGMMLMASAADLIMMFLALEIFSVALYVLVGFRRASLEGQESAMKYFLLGAFSSAFFLLGIALAYGAVGTTNLYPTGETVENVTAFIRTTPSQGMDLLVLATGLLIVGLGFKIAAVPFHMWTPDAYQGAPSPVTGFMAAATKLAGFAALIRLLDAILYPLRWDWRPIVLGIAVVTMAVGSVLAVVQEDVKRVLAYSSIAHAGFVLTGVVATNDRGVSGALFYLATYGVTVLGAFAVVAILAGRDERRVRLSDYRGLFFDHPLLAGALSLFLLSLAGVPITSGFVGKLLVFGAAVEAGYSWLVVVGVVTSAIAAFFYLRIMVVMYMQEAPEGEKAVAAPGPLAHGVVALSAAATIFFGLFWSPLIQAAEEARFFFG